MKNYIKLITVLAILIAEFFVLKNEVFAQTINTGNASSQTVIENVINTNDVKCQTCNLTPTQIPPTITPSTVQTPTSTPTPAQTASPTPTNTPGGGEQPGGGGSVGGPTEEVSLPQKNGEVLGLSTTSGETNWFFQIIKLLPSLFLGMASLFFLKKNEKV